MCRRRTQDQRLWQRNTPGVCSCVWCRVLLGPTLSPVCCVVCCCVPIIYGQPLSSGSGQHQRCAAWWLVTVCPYAQPSQASLITTTRGTPAFMAPEVAGGHGAPYLAAPAELWAVGVCLHMFVTGDGARAPAPAGREQQQGGIERHRLPDDAAGPSGGRERGGGRRLIDAHHACTSHPAHRTPTCTHALSATGLCLHSSVLAAACLLCKAVPYSAPTTALLYERIASPEAVSLPQGCSVSDTLAALLGRLLDKNPTTRASLTQVRMQAHVSMSVAQMRICSI